MSRHVISGNIGEHPPQHASNRPENGTVKASKDSQNTSKMGAAMEAKNLEREAVVLHRKSSTPSVWVRDCY